MWFNPIVKALLRSPLHGLIGKSIMLITYSGRKSGQVYTIPVNCVRTGNVFIITSFRHRSWWRNLRGGAPVVLRVQGQDLKAVGEVVEDDEGVAAGLMEYLRLAPEQVGYFKVGLDSEGHPKPDDTAQAALKRVIIRLNC